MIPVCDQITSSEHLATGDKQSHITQRWLTMTDIIAAGANARGRIPPERRRIVTLAGITT
jgi:hypothetical protein